MRNKKHLELCQSVTEKLKLATMRDAASHSYFDALLRGDQHEAERLFKELNTMIHGSLLPEENW
jgi:hypothetical protein